MILLKKILIRILFLVLVSCLGAGFFMFYPFIFSKTLKGEILAVERVDVPLAILNTNTSGSGSGSGSGGSSGGTSGFNPQAFSFAVALKDEKTKEIYTASSEDRQWAAVSKGFCAEIKIFPYPPWNLQKSGTYYGARLLKLYECSK